MELSRVWTVDSLLIIPLLTAMCWGFALWTRDGWSAGWNWLLCISSAPIGSPADLCLDLPLSVPGWPTRRLSCVRTVVVLTDGPKSKPMTKMCAIAIAESPYCSDSQILYSTVPTLTPCHCNEYDHLSQDEDDEGKVLCMRCKWVAQIVERFLNINMCKDYTVVLISRLSLLSIG